MIDKAILLRHVPEAIHTGAKAAAALQRTTLRGWCIAALQKAVEAAGVTGGEGDAAMRERTRQG